MANIQEALYSELKKDTSIKALTLYATGLYNIYPDFIPPERLLAPDILASKVQNFIVYSFINEPQNNLLDLNFDTVQVSVYSNVKDTQLTLKAHVLRVLNRFGPGFLGQTTTRAVKKIWLDSGSSSGFNNDTKLFFTDLIFKIKYFGDNV